MTNRLLAGAMLALSLVVPVSAAAQGAAPALPPPELNAQMSDAQITTGLDTWLTGSAEEGRFNGAVLVARDGREIYASARGVADLATRAPLDPDTRFAIASIGKALTHVAIAQLIESGRLSAQTTLGEIIPDYPQTASRAATIDQLINHRAGIADIFGPAFREADKASFAANADYFRFVAVQPPLFSPGEREEYCNGCYVVLGEVIARVSGQSYEDYIAAHVLAQAGMTRSGFFRRDRLPENAATFTGMPRGPEGGLMDVSQFHGVAGNAAGNLYSTVRDMLAFDNAVREHRLVGPDLTAQVLRGEPQAGRATSRIGFAGGGPGVNTVLYGNGAWTLVVLTNREPPTAEAIAAAVFPLLTGPRPQ